MESEFQWPKKKSNLKRKTHTRREKKALKRKQKRFFIAIDPLTAELNQFYRKLIDNTKCLH